MSDLLSDGRSVEVRRLAFLELEDLVPYADPGLYIHVYVVEGHDQPVGYGLSDFGEIPERPEGVYEETVPGTELHARWSQYNLYRAVLTHDRKRSELREVYLENCARHILTECIGPADRLRIVMPEDFEVVYRLALCPEVSEEDVVAVLATTFQGYMEGEAVVGVLEEAAWIGRFLYTDQALGDAINVGSWAGPTRVRPAAG